MRVHVAFTPAEAVAAPTGVVIDVLRATSTVCQALASGYDRVLSAPGIEDAKDTHAREGGILAGERGCVRVPGFDLGNSPQEFATTSGGTVVLTTTNGTRALIAAAERCDRVLAGSLLNLDAVVTAAGDTGDGVVIICAGVEGELALDDAYCAGRIVTLLGGEPTDAANAAMRIVRSFASGEEALRASQSARNLLAAGLESDIAYCARESALDVVPRYHRMVGSAAELRL